MRTDVPAGLQDHMDTKETTLCWCWRIIPTDTMNGLFPSSDGTGLGFTNHDRDLTFDSTTFRASTGFLASELESQLGMSVDNMDVYGAVDSDQITEEMIEKGYFDDATVEIFLVNWEDVSERLLMKKGVIGDIKRGSIMFEAEVRGLSYQLQQIKGRSYNYTCDAILGDSRCNAANLSGSTFTGTATVVSTNGFSSVVVSGLDAYADGWFTRGLATFTSGDNDTLKREVRSHYNQNRVITVTFWEPLPYEIASSDTFTIRAGCDKTWATCKAKFSNGDNFRGFPHVPGSRTVTSYANQGEPNFDGGGNFVGKD